MSVIQPKGHADVSALRNATAFISAPDEMEAERLCVLELCRRFAKLLKPFALVDNTNERWRDEVLAEAKKVKEAAEKLHIDDPALKTLLQGINGLENYESVMNSLEIEDQMMKEDAMDAPEMMDAIAKGVAQNARSRSGNLMKYTAEAREDENRRNNLLKLVKRHL